MATVIKKENFDYKEDANSLRIALKTLSVDEQTIIDISTTRNNEQRQEIRSNYKLLFGKDLVRDFDTALSFNFKEVVVALYTKPLIYDVDCLTDAIYGPGTNETTLIEILVTRTNEDVQRINKIYSLLHEKTLQNDIIGDTSGFFKRLLVSLSTGKRDESFLVDAIAARRDAKRLRETTESNSTEKEETFIMILGSQSFSQLHAVFNMYYKIAEKDIKKTIKKEFSGDLKQGFLAIVDFVRNPTSFFARSLYKSMKGIGTDDKRLIRSVVSRSEIDMKYIKSEFQTRYQKTLKSFIHGDTSGNYRKILLALIAE